MHLMILILYMAIGAVPGFILAGKVGLLLGIIAGFLLRIIDQLDKLNDHFFPERSMKESIINLRVRKTRGSTFVSVMFSPPLFFQQFLRFVG